jgi:tRNA G18 (ribose-2'-O)-methylase SpoU
MSVEEGETELQRILRRLTAKHLAGKQSHAGYGVVSGVSGKGQQLKVTTLTEDVAGVFGGAQKGISSRDE